jgi:hypothetical protein
MLLDERRSAGTIVLDLVFVFFGQPPAEAKRDALAEGVDVPNQVGEFFHTTSARFRT